jgi:hypothetical protein
MSEFPTDDIGMSLKPKNDGPTILIRRTVVAAAGYNPLMWQRRLVA